MIRGIYTTEFWLTLGTLVATFTSALGGFLPKPQAIAGLVLVVVGYTISRGLAKIK